MPKATVMSHKNRGVIRAPDSPPATPPREGHYWSTSHANRHAHPQYSNPTGPRAIVQRAKFSLQNPRTPAARSRHSSSRQPAAGASAQQQPRGTHPSSVVGSPVFKFEEELNGSFHFPPRSQPSKRRGPAKMHTLRRSESLDTFKDDEAFNGRISESAPGKGDNDAMGSTFAQAPSIPKASPSAYSSTVDVPRVPRRQADFAASAPIQIPSRSKQREERLRRAAATAKTTATAAGSSSCHASARHGKPRRVVQNESRYGLNYSSSEDSIEHRGSRGR